MRWLFGLTVLVFRGDRAKNAELLVLRHENVVLRRNAGRARYEPADRVWFAVLTRFIPRRRWAEENPLWAYRRIHGEPTNLGVAVALSTFYEILRAAGIDPAPHRDGRARRRFLRAARRDPVRRLPAC